MPRIGTLRIAENKKQLLKRSQYQGIRIFVFLLQAAWSVSSANAQTSDSQFSEVSLLLRDTHDKKSCHSVTHASLACKTPVCAYSPQASVSRSYMSKAKRGWKLGRRDTAPTHDQRLVSHTPVAPTSGSSPYFPILGPATRRSAQHHPLRVRPLPSARPHSHGPGFQPSQNIQKYPKTITDCLKILQRNATKVSGSRLPFGPWACKIPSLPRCSPNFAPLLLATTATQWYASCKKKALGTPSKLLQTEPLPPRASNGKSHLQLQGGTVPSLSRRAH